MVARNPVRQVLVAGQVGELVAREGKYFVRLPGGVEVRMASRTPRLGPAERALVLQKDAFDRLGFDPDLSSGRWVGNRERNGVHDVLDSLIGDFSFLEEDADRGVAGLRAPQIGAVHAVLGHWTTKSSVPATVVMPTGTGKTETMLALFAAKRIPQLLVIVPSDALRQQIATKFETLGVLQELGIVSKTSLYPRVGQLKHGFKTVDDVRTFVTEANVIVTTPDSLNASTPEARSALLNHCTTLFVDEAHHVGATTWRRLRDDFSPKPVVQFTATPFREDGRHLGGRLIYAFPLRLAQSQGYFSRINYASVLDLGNQDEAIARRAIEQLRADLGNNLDHLIMARVSRIGRADDVLPIYGALAPEFNPVVLHSTTKATERQAALAAIQNRDSRIVICVNMLGEGFDLPALKVAAIHDPHKSLGVTLQFVGRFARTTGPAIGEATVVVGRPEREFDRRLRRLYAEDADWNHIIRYLAEGAVGEQQEVSDFEAGFGSLPDEVSIRSLLPKMSTVVYRAPSADDWDPQAILELFSEERLLTVPIAINASDRIAWFVTENRTEVTWGELRTVEEVTYDLYIVYWDRSNKLLYINSSNNASLHQTLASAVAGDGATRITGEHVYRVMANIKRLVPTNVGLLDIRNTSRRFSMLVGADVSEGFPTTEAQTKTKTNIFAYGFEDGNRSGVGASLKGRIWSHRVASSLKEWMNWCDRMGAKLIDSGISVDDVMRDFIRPKVVEVRPELVALALEWAWPVFLNMSEDLRIEKDGVAWPLIDAEFEVAGHARTGPIQFRLVSPDWSIDCSVNFDAQGMHFSVSDGEAKVRTRNQSVSLEEFLDKNPPLIFLEDDAAILPPGLLVKPDRTLPPFDSAKLSVLDWSGIKLTVESQGPTRRQDSIQARVIQYVDSLASWDLILDDDGTGEVADIVAMRIEGDELFIHLVHCKFVAGGKPRAQVEDLYEVCGQAQKSTQWRRRVGTLFDYLVRREKKRLERGAPSGFMKGTASDLYRLADTAPLLKPTLTIAIAQPGVKKTRISGPQLELLGATETYLFESAYARLDVYSSS